MIDKKSLEVKTDEKYWLNNWGNDYFKINDLGHAVVCPHKNDKTIDLYELVKSLVKRGIEPPILFRFDGIIQDRITHIYSAFQNAIEEYEYKSNYILAYPVKVNQQKHVVDVIRRADKNNNLSIEVGSKPELIAILALHDVNDTLLLCNGYKDKEYIELALLSKKIGKRPIIIIEQLYELKLVLEIAEELNIEAEIGIRIKPISKGSGRWSSSGGELAKFGLNTNEINILIKMLTDKKKSHWLKLLHFHIGSQLSSIIPFKKTLREASRMYIEIKKKCPSMCFFDVGGGLAIDYDGSKTTTDCSMNYTTEQYARDIVHTIKTICDEEKISHPTIISESGRAIVAHHSILITEVIDVSKSLDDSKKLEKPPTNHPMLLDLYEIYISVDKENCMEALHDCADLRDNAVEKFIQGDLSLEERAYAEKTFKYLSAKILMLAKQMDFVPEEIEKLEEKLVDLYFCNFSVFQSLPDSWAIQQIFPVMPIHRLNEDAKRRAMIVDLTCDSDGIIDKFIDPAKKTKWINLHEFNNSPYYLGIFLVGAYQETLGGLHNLFGDTNAVHVDVDEHGCWEIKNLIEGDTIREVLGYMQYMPEDLMEQLRFSIEKSLKNNSLLLEDAAKLKKRFKQALESYTYIVI